ncbi:MAG: VanZ family protein [bacterium]
MHLLKKYWPWLLVAAYIAFIFSNSLADGTTSGELSGSISAAVYGWLLKIGVKFNPDTFHFLIRKMAHFTEYAGLGILIRLATGKYTGNGVWLLRLMFMVSVPLVDETIQRFVPGRGGSLRDCALDMAGYLTGFLIASLIAYFWQKRKNSDK